jgi:hypothetical protein
MMKIGTFIQAQGAEINREPEFEEPIKFRVKCTKCGESIDPETHNTIFHVDLCDPCLHAYIRELEMEVFYNEIHTV